MKIAVVNKYLHGGGGAEACALAEADLLRQMGHDVVLMGTPPCEGVAEKLPAYEVPDIVRQGELSIRDRFRAAERILYSLTARRTMRNLLQTEQPDIVHLHDIHHQLSPSVIDAAARAGVPTVMTLHNYKLTCPTFRHYRHGVPCERCGRRRYLNAIRFRCARWSAARSALDAFESFLHERLLGLYEKVLCFICPSRFIMEKTQQLTPGLPMVHLGNFVDVGQYRPRPDASEERVVYFGRLTPEKGVMTLLHAAAKLDCDFSIAGTGPQEQALREWARRAGADNVHFAGYREGGDLRELVARARCVVVPSEWYENNPLAVLEAFAMGKPVVGAHIGGLPELVTDERGCTFTPGAVEQLCRAILRFIRNPDKAQEAGFAGRRYVEKHHSPRAHYERLMQIYEQARNCQGAS